MKKRNIRKILGKNVKYYRFKARFTQEDLAERTELSPRYISDIENGRGNVPLDTIELIARALKVSSLSLLKDRAEKQLPKRVNMRQQNK